MKLRRLGEPLAFCRWRNFALLLGTQSPVGLVDRLDQVLEAGRFVDRPGAVEALTQQGQIMFGQQPDGHDTLLGQVRVSKSSIR